MSPDWKMTITVWTAFALLGLLIGLATVYLSPNHQQTCITEERQ